jgi:TPR repeat protein
MSRMTRPEVGFGVTALLALVIAGTVVELRGLQPAGPSLTGAAPSSVSPSQVAPNSESHAGDPGGSRSAAQSTLQARQANDIARKQLLERANQGDLSAQAELCRQDIRSRDPQIVARAHFWCSVAARAGDPPSERYFGDLLREGQGVPKDEQAALDWYEQAAKHQDTGAMYVRGNLLLDRNTPADEARGLGWIQQAARKGDSRAIALLQRRGQTSEPHDSEQSEFAKGAVR